MCNVAITLALIDHIKSKNPQSVAIAALNSKNEVGFIILFHTIISDPFFEVTELQNSIVLVYSLKAWRNLRYFRNSRLLRDEEHSEVWQTF